VLFQALIHKADFVANQGDIRKLNHTNRGIARGIWALYQRAYQTEADIVGVADFPPLRRTVETIRRAKSSIFGYFENGTLTAISETQTDDEVLFIDGFVVDPQFFRKGHGSRLLRFVLDESRCDRAVTETAAANQPALLFYEKFGFTETDRWNSVEGIQIVTLGVNLRINQSMAPTAESGGQ
jgi:ribosomal protein S18 acetylase RimI-like enzyme